MHDQPPAPTGELDSLFTDIAAQPRTSSGPIPMDRPQLNAKELHKRDHREFRQALKSGTPIPWVTPTLVVINLVLYAWVAFLSQNWIDISYPVLVEWGGSLPALTGRDEWWRLLTCCFLHASIWHVGFNLWCLWDAGQFAERLFGNIGVLVLYVATGVAGSLAAYWWNPDALVVGASGAVFGLIGALIAKTWMHGEEFPEGGLQRLRNSLATFVIFNLVIGALHPNISEAAHLGGLGMGILIGSVLALPLTPVGKAQRLVRAALAIVLSGVVLGTAWSQLPPAPANLRAEELALEKQLPELFELHDELTTAYEARKITNPQYADQVEAKLLRPMQVLTRHWERMPDVPKRQKERVFQVAAALDARAQAWQALVAALRSTNSEEAQSHADQYMKKWRDAKELQRRLAQ